MVEQPETRCHGLPGQPRLSPRSPPALPQLGVSRSALAGGLNLMMHHATTEMYNVAGGCCESVRLCA